MHVLPHLGGAFCTSTAGGGGGGGGLAAWGVMKYKLVPKSKCSGIIHDNEDVSGSGFSFIWYQMKPTLESTDCSVPKLVLFLHFCAVTNFWLAQN